MPNWDPMEIKIMDMSYTHFFYKFFCHREAKKFYASKFFENLKKHIKNIVNDKRKNIFIYAGTKTNIVIFLSALLAKS